MTKDLKISQMANATNIDIKKGIIPIVQDGLNKSIHPLQILDSTVGSKAPEVGVVGSVNVENVNTVVDNKFKELSTINGKPLTNGGDIVIKGDVEDVKDLKKYVRTKGLWVEETPFPDVPDNNKYVRLKGKWIKETPFPEVANDGLSYVRKHGEWVAIAPVPAAFVILSLSEYDTLNPKDPNILYFIKGLI